MEDQRNNNLKEVYNWIEENQNKAIFINICAGNFAIDVTLEEGYRISDYGGLDDIELICNKTDNTYHIMLFDIDFKFTINKSEMELPDFDFELLTYENNTNIGMFRFMLK